MDRNEYDIQESKESTVSVPVIYQEGIETVDSAYKVFLKRGGNNLQSYIFELETTAVRSMDPERIEEYLTIIFQEQGLAMAQVTGLL